MKKSLFIIMLIFGCGLFAQAQVDTSFHLLRKLRGDISFFEADNLDNIYLVSSTGQLKKINANGDSVAVFNQLRKSGKLSYIDVSNPLRLVLYYKDYSQVVMLDRLLNARNTIDLRKQNIFQVQAICLSYDNKIWLYDEFENKLKKIDEDGKLLFETADFRQLFGEAYSFSSVADVNGLIYLYDHVKGIFVFDYYGSLKNRINFTGADHIKISGEYILSVRSDSLIRYKPVIFATESFILPPLFREADLLNYTASRLYMLKNDELSVYEIRSAK